MAFWSGEKLATVLPGLITQFDIDSIDCASYRLAVGEQVFVTSDKFASSGPTEPIVSHLTNPPNHTLRIRPGQFAFILTEEVVTVPNDAIALISMRTSYKFKGLINVSGFHVDPGWTGKLIFSVYNAGPAEVIVERGQKLFMIVYADLDQKTTKTYDGTSKGQKGINTSLLQNMTEQVFSPLMLQRRIEDLKSGLAAVERTANTFKVVTYSVSSAVVILLAAAALFATFAPATLGVIIARMMEGGGYEMRLKPSDPAPKELERMTGVSATPASPPSSSPSKK